MNAAAVLRKYIIPLIVAAVALYVYMRSGGEAAKISRVTDAAARGYEIVRSEDTHGGCHGDGHTFIIAAFDGGAARELSALLEKNSEWKPLPLGRTLTALAYGLREGANQFGPYVTGRGGGALLPEIERGYYFFKDRRSEAAADGGEGILSRASLNFTLAVFDTERNRLYYYELDT